MCIYVYLCMSAYKVTLHVYKGLCSEHFKIHTCTCTCTVHVITVTREVECVSCKMWSLLMRPLTRDFHCTSTRTQKTMHMFLSYCVNNKININVRHRGSVSTQALSLDTAKLSSPCHYRRHNYVTLLYN